MNKTIEIIKYRKNFNYELPLDPDDPMLVDMSKVRGQFSRVHILRQLGMSSTEKGYALSEEILPNQYILFGGHRGCGKSTELRALGKDLEGPQRFAVIALDVVKDLDSNNLRYCDIVLLQARELIKYLEQNQIDVPKIYLESLSAWFYQSIKSIVKIEDFTSEFKASAKTGITIPFIVELFSSVATAIKINSSYKEEIRREVKNSFSILAQNFNQLLDFSRQEIKKKQIGRSLIFIIDGTDRLRSDDAQALFIEDVHQLKQIQANFIYCTPIQILAEQGQIGQNFDAIFRLPMIKLEEKGDSKRIESSWEAMRKLITNRIPQEAFADDEVLDTLIAASGGHPRDLLRLVILCFQETDDAPFTKNMADTVVKNLTAEYKRLIEPNDYRLLFEIDKKGKDYTPVTKETRRLLYNLVLLEYNNFWWRSHPVVKKIPAYSNSEE